MNLLFLSPWFPFPPTNGSELRINALLRGLAAEHQVTLISFIRRNPSDADLRTAHEYCEQVHLVPWQEFHPHSRHARWCFLSRRPRSVVSTYSTAMAECIRKAVNTKRYDITIASELGPAGYANEFGAIPALLDDLELGVFYQQASAPAPAHLRARRKLMWAKQRAYVSSLLPRFHACTVVSHQEKQLLSAVAPQYTSVELIPNCVDLASYQRVNAQRDSHTLIFTGAFTYRVNYEAMVWFLEEVYPLIQQYIPSVRLLITGDHAGLSLPPARNVILTGYVDDIKSAVASASVSIVPILQGGGTRLKILEAMALNTPVVSTAKGVEGLDVIHDEHLIVADTPQSFACGVVRILGDPVLHSRLAANACQLVQSKYNWDVFMPRFLDLVSRTASSSSSFAG